MKTPRPLLLMLLLLLLTLGGCGNKGPLYLPKPEKHSD
ncbi:LPS translocon maturation chaperone LptM [Thiolapillus sp.]